MVQYKTDNGTTDFLVTLCIHQCIPIKKEKKSHVEGKWKCKGFVNDIL